MAHLYAIRFSNDLIKVGMTKRNPEKRIAQHASALSIANITIIQSEHVECENNSVFLAESMLIKICNATNGSIKKSNEWFYGLKFDDVEAWMRECAKRASHESKNITASKPIDIDSASCYFEDKSKKVIHLAAAMVNLDQDLAKTIYDGLDRSRQEIVTHCWKFMIDCENDDSISGEDAVALLVLQVSRMMCIHHLFGPAGIITRKF